MVGSFTPNRKETRYMLNRGIPMPGPTLPGAAVLAALLAPAVDAQQVLEIDLTTGRTFGRPPPS